MTHHKHYTDYVGSRADKHFKSTLFETGHMLVGMNCLDPGQDQHIHAHPGSDKIYVVFEGHGEFTIGDDTFTASEGTIIHAPADVPHGVRNPGDTRLAMMIVIAPPPNH